MRCFTLRDNTERPVTIRAGTNTLLGLDPSGIARILAATAAGPPPRAQPPPGWDGHAAERAAAVIAGEEIGVADSWVPASAVPN